MDRFGSVSIEQEYSMDLKGKPRDGADVTLVIY
jgi:hypothetical protein